MTKNQKGSAVSFFILAVVIVCIIVIAVLRIQSGRTNTASTTTTTVSNESAVSTDYKNEEKSLQLTFPKEWGEVVFSQSKGFDYADSLEFTKNKSLQVRINKKDYVGNGFGGFFSPTYYADWYMCGQEVRPILSVARTTQATCESQLETSSFNTPELTKVNQKEVMYFKSAVTTYGECADCESESVPVYAAIVRYNPKGTYDTVSISSENKLLVNKFVESLR